MMRATPFILLLALLPVLTGCKKHDPPLPAAHTCPVPMKLTSYTYNGGIVPVSYYPDGSLKSAGGEITWFNNGLLGQYIRSTDTVILDSLGRLLIYKQPFFSGGNNARQTAQYFYDGLNRVVRTVTHTGNGLDYLQDLTYANGDVVEMGYFVGLPGGSIKPFKFSFYDTLCPSPYFGIQYWSQIGITQNRHLLKSTLYGADTTFYSYLIDSNNRILASYRDYDNSGWVYARAVDTTYYYYSCQ